MGAIWGKEGVPEDCEESSISLFTGAGSSVSRDGESGSRRVGEEV